MGSGVVARPNPKNVTALRNGLLDVEAYLRGAPYEQYFIQHTPQFFNLVSADFDFAPSAPTPTELLRFLATVFPGDQASIDLLQEWFGYCQVSDVHLQKMMLLWGITRSGKGVLAELLENLLGKASVIPMKLSDFGSSGGLWAAMTSSLGIFYDARISKWADSSAAVETLLSVAAGEPQCVNRKFLKPVKVSLPTRLMVISNELPQVSDTSGALAGRFLILHFTQSFLHREDHGITARCLRELPSILLWSLEGLRRLRTNDRFTVPASSLESHQDLMETISPVTGFVSDRCTLDPEARVEESVLFAEYIKWCTAQNQLRPGTCKSFASKLTTSSGVSKYRGSDGLGRPRMFRGIRVGTTPIFAIAATPSM
jgi:putative DNA primase/helicase